MLVSSKKDDCIWFCNWSWDYIPSTDFIFTFMWAPYLYFEPFNFLIKSVNLKTFKFIILSPWRLWEKSWSMPKITLTHRFDFFTFASWAPIYDPNHSVFSCRLNSRYWSFIFASSSILGKVWTRSKLLNHTFIVICTL